MFQKPKPQDGFDGGASVVAPPVSASPQPPSEALARAHEALLRDRDTQFRFDAPETPREPPRIGWLADLLDVIGPLLRYLFWAALAVVVAAVVWFIVREVLRAKFPDRFGKRKSAAEEVEWRPEAEDARALLEDADALAAQGRYAEAAHLLLLRSVEDIEGRDAALLRPSLTARDIAELPALPSGARHAFGRIAAVVERGIFAGRDVDAEGWTECRRAYADFAFPETWTPQRAAA